MFGRDKRSEQDLREEIESHLALEADRVARDQGLSPGEARHAARRAFGNATSVEEHFFDSQRWQWAERLRRNLALALRGLRRRPGFAFAAILTLGIGIGFNSAVFTLFYALSYRALPVRDAASLVNVYQTYSGTYGRSVHGVTAMVSYEEFKSYRAAVESARTNGGAVSGVAAYANDVFAFSGNRPGVIGGSYVSCSYLGVVGTRLALGRDFDADDCARPGAPAVAVLSHAAWMREFGGDSSVVGRTVRINQLPFTVVGVAERGFTGLTFIASDVFIPVTMQMAVSHGVGGTDSLLVKDWSWMTMAARLAPGASAASARAQLSLTARRRDAEFYPGRTTHVIVEPGALLNFPEARQRGTIVAVLLAALGALVVMMVCANIMNLLLARGIARRREFGIRLAIGASRHLLVEQLLTESVVLAVLGGALGLAIAVALPPLVLGVVPLAGLQVDVSPDWRVLAFTLVVSLGTALVFGLVPALQATSIDLVSASKGGMVGSGHQVRPSRLRAGVVGLQVAGSTLLLIVAVLFVRAAQKGATIDPGFATEDVAAFELNLQLLGYSSERTQQTYEALRDRAAAAPGVQSVAYADPLPLLGRRSDSVNPDDDTNNLKTVNNVSLASVSASYLETMEIPLVTGRMYTDAEAVAAGAENRPVVVNAKLAGLLWPGESALGRRLRMSRRHYVVVGVASDTRAISLGDPPPFIYVPADPRTDRGLKIVVRGGVALPALLRNLPGWARELDPTIVATGQRMQERLALELLPARTASAVSGATGALTLLLALIGIYGVVSHGVQQRTRDIAVRLALGATARVVVRQVMVGESRAVVIGIVVGTAAAVAASGAIRGVLLGVSPLDPVAYLVAALVLVGASAAAMYVPASRAARVNPAQTLRED